MEPRNFPRKTTSVAPVLPSPRASPSPPNPYQPWNTASFPYKKTAVKDFNGNPGVQNTS